MLNAITLNVVILSGDCRHAEFLLLHVSTLNVIMLNVHVLNVIMAKCQCA
jgi:hypothetical protein